MLNCRILNFIFIIAFCANGVFAITPAGLTETSGVNAAYINRVGVLLKSKNDALRAAAVLLVGQMPASDEERIGILLGCTDDPASIVRTYAVNMLLRNYSGISVQEALKDKFINSRGMAKNDLTFVISKMNQINVLCDSAVIKELLGMLDSSNYVTVLAALEGLNKITAVHPEALMNDAAASGIIMKAKRRLRITLCDRIYDKVIRVSVLFPESGNVQLISTAVCMNLMDMGYDVSDYIVEMAAESLVGFDTPGNEGSYWFGVWRDVVVKLLKIKPFVAVNFAVEYLMKGRRRDAELAGFADTVLREEYIYFVVESMGRNLQTARLNQDLYEKALFRAVVLLGRIQEEHGRIVANVIRDNNSMNPEIKEDLLTLYGEAGRVESGGLNDLYFKRVKSPAYANDMAFLNELNSGLCGEVVAGYINKIAQTREHVINRERENILRDMMNVSFNDSQMQRLTAYLSAGADKYKPWLRDMISGFLKYAESLNEKEKHEQSGPDSADEEMVDIIYEMIDRDMKRGRMIDRDLFYDLIRSGKERFVRLAVNALRSGTEEIKKRIKGDLMQIDPQGSIAGLSGFLLSRDKDLSSAVAEMLKYLQVSWETLGLIKEMQFELADDSPESYERKRELFEKLIMRGYDERVIELFRDVEKLPLIEEFLGKSSSAVKRNFKIICDRSIDAREAAGLIIKRGVASSL